ncbi:MAG TPA: MFS transporter [Lachnospiraceae bacterium]|nr:MFS transporter [Lachnospiraceae bacterium]
MSETKETGFTKSTAWSFALSQGGGFMLIQATVASFISVYMTDTVMLPAAVGSVIMFIATLWDAINDPMMGAICDRTKTRFGSYRPYLLWVPAVLTVVSIFLFRSDTVSSGAKVIYFATFYILFGMSVTALTMPQMALIPAVTKNDKERGQAIQLGIISIAIAFTIASTFTSGWVAAIGSYAPLMAVYGVLAILANLWLFRSSKERYHVESANKRSVWKDLGVFVKHKELVVVLFVWMLSSVGYGIMFSSSVYYMMYYIMRPDLIGLYMGILSVGALVSMMVVMPLLLRKCKTVTQVFIITQALTFVCYVLLFFFGNKNMILLYAVSFLATAFSSMEQGLINFYVNDTIDYLQLKENVQLNGMVSAIKGFSYKCGSTLVSSGLLAILAVAGYVAGAVGSQPDSAMFAFNMLRFGIPAVTCILIILLLKANPLDKCRGEINVMKEKMKAVDEK